MELAYMSDPMMRFTALNAYPTWEELNYEDKYSRTQKSHCDKEAKTSEKNCRICQEKKKRSLSDYIKSKQIGCQNSAVIHEEDEEVEEDEHRHQMDSEKTRAESGHCELARVRNL